MITIERTPEEEEASAQYLEALRAGKVKRTHKIKNPVETFKLTVKVEMKFKGKDARAARRWIYDRLRPFPPMFAGFDGPRDPIVMSFYCAAGNQVIDWLNMSLPSQQYEDLEIKLHYQCSEDPDHKGDYKLSNRKTGLARLFDSQKGKEADQM